MTAHRRRRRIRPAGEVSAPVPSTPRPDPDDASTGIVVGVCAETGTGRVPVLAPAHAGRAALQMMTRRPIHPLAVYVLERGIGIGRAAELLGLSERALRDVLAWRRRLSAWRESDIAVDLGTTAEALFPPSESAEGEE